MLLARWGAEVRWRLKSWAKFWASFGRISWGVISGSHWVRLATGLSAIPQGIICWKPVRSGLTFRANPCIVIQCLTLMPMAATFFPSIQTPVSPGILSAGRSYDFSVWINTVSSCRKYQWRSWR